ncbi:hypothetical protein VTO58DRAFT_100675 [Aureobasidium pullulans]
MTVSRFSIPRVQDLLRRVSRPSELVNTYRSHTTSIKTFLTRLPPELRIMVYEFVFVDMEERRCPHPLLKVSRLVQPNNFKVLLNKIEYDSTVRGNSDGSEVEEYSNKFKDELGVSGECSVELLANLLHRLND